MKVKELIELLSHQDPESEVVASSDAEGNGYSPVEGVYTGYYKPECTWMGEWKSHMDEDDFEDEDDEETYNEFVEDDDTIKAVCIFPVN